MSIDPQGLWLQSAQNFQKSLGESWAQASEAFRHMNLGAVGEQIGVNCRDGANCSECAVCTGKTRCGQTTVLG